MNVATDENILVNWLETSSRNAISALAGRHALRALPMAGPVLSSMSDLGARAELQGAAALSLLRACLTGCVSCRYLDIEVLNALNHSHSLLNVKSEDFGRYESRLQRSLGNEPGNLPGLYPASSALSLTELAATAAPSKQALGQMASLLSARRPNPVSTMIVNAETDIEKIRVREQPADIFNASLWLSHIIPDDLAMDLESFQSFFQTAPDVWGFWKRWYNGFLIGIPVSWEVQSAVAKIPDDEWTKGPEWIARKIAEIERDFASNSDCQPDFEPQDVSHLLRNPTAFSAQSVLTADYITGTIEAFHRDTGINQVPEAFSALIPISQSFQTVSAILQSPGSNSTETELRQEIGRLSARIVELEAALKDATNATPAIFSDAFKKKAGESLGDWKMYGAILATMSTLAGTLWIVSGDEIGPEKRIEMLKSYCFEIWGVCNDDGTNVVPRPNLDPTAET